MKVNRTWKIVVGVATLGVALLPFFFMFLFFMPFFFIAAAGDTGSEPNPAFIATMVALVFVMISASFVQLGLMLFYFVHVVKNKEGSEFWRILLGIGNYFMPYFAMPAYYLVYIWPETPPSWALEPKAGRGSRFCRRPPMRGIYTSHRGPPGQSYTSPPIPPPTPLPGSFIHSSTKVARLHRADRL